MLAAFQSHGKLVCAVLEVNSNAYTYSHCTEKGTLLCQGEQDLDKKLLRKCFLMQNTLSTANSCDAEHSLMLLMSTAPEHRGAQA